MSIRFEFTDTSKPVYLHFQHVKFWEIKLAEKMDNICEVGTRCGKLNPGDIEDITTVSTMGKNFSNLVEAIQYVEKHVSLKLEKGYAIHKKAEKIESEPPKSGNWSINILPPSDDREKLKRKPDESLVREENKKIHKTDTMPLDAEETGNYFKRTDTIPLDEEDGDSQVSFRPPSNEPARRRRGSFDVNSQKLFEEDNDEEEKEFQGEYLTRDGQKGTKFCKIQVNGSFVKVDTGAVGNNKWDDYTFHQYKDNVEAQKEGRKLMIQKLNEGFSKQTDKFVYDFKSESVNDLFNNRDFLHSMPKSAPSSPKRGSRKSSSNTNFNALALPGRNQNTYSDTSRRSSIVSGDSDDDDDDDDQNSVILSQPGSPRVSGAALKPNPLGKPITGFCSSVMLAHKFEDKGKNTDPTGWYMSEKLDGVRCFWNGSQMYSRNGNRFFPPKWFTKGFPDSPLDGELWTVRDNFQKCVSIVRKQNPIDDEWKKVTYMVFEAPNLNFSFAKKYDKMKEVFDGISSPYIKLHHHIPCKGVDHLVKELEKVEKLGGEGLMLRNPDSQYEKRRSNNLLKVKTFHDDEATIIGFEEGKGRNQGVVGAFRVRNTNGVEFSVGSGLNDDMRARPPKKGTVITYKYQSLSNSGTPRFPTFVRIYQKT